jgi:hypothetical protein
VLGVVVVDDEPPCWRGGGRELERSHGQPKHSKPLSSRYTKTLLQTSMVSQCASTNLSIFQTFDILGLIHQYPFNQ